MQTPSKVVNDISENRKNECDSPLPLNRIVNTSPRVKRADYIKVEKNFTEINNPNNPTLTNEIQHLESPRVILKRKKGPLMDIQKSSESLDLSSVQSSQLDDKEVKLNVTQQQLKIQDILNRKPVQVRSYDFNLLKLGLKTQDKKYLTNDKRKISSMILEPKQQ